MHFLGIHIGVELLNHRVCICLALAVINKKLTNGYSKIHFHQDCVIFSVVVHLYQHLVLFVLFILAIVVIKNFSAF